MNKQEQTFKSSNKINDIHYYIYEPSSTPIGIIQVVHGMVEHAQLYEAFASYITDKGYILCAHDHLGHGNTGLQSNSFGYFADRDGYTLLIEDTHKLTQLMKIKYGNLPYFLVGHSMGSMIARNYLSSYHKDITGCILSGTAGRHPLSFYGLYGLKLMAKLKGSKTVSPKVNKMMFNGYQDKKDPNSNWATRDMQLVKAFEQDPLCQFTFTLSAYVDLLTMLRKCNKKAWFTSFPSDVPILLMSGYLDPVGMYGAGIRQVFEKLRKKDHTNVRIKLYKGEKHNILQDLNKEQVFNDVQDWIEKYM